ncbi:acetyl-CoA acetyltransferase [Rhodococcus sp. X156]|uniref:acetyl-CoA acetyltransferase n=1 Tax=Rhodococcus sp. X156 TaxID=2499145 RepID=UPI000FDC0A37|nr:acetyl-CoA acetyltransferase [Rhodococcus sp. X156]
MPDPRHIPVIVGVGQLRHNRERTVADAREPLELMLDAVALAAADAGVPQLPAHADSIDVVNVVSWSYDDLPGLVAQRVGADPQHRQYTPVGGQWPARLLDAAAARIAAGESTIALLVGGEAQSSTGALAKAGVDPVQDCGWSAAPGGPAAFDPELLGGPENQAAGLILPTRVYPLFDNALSHQLGQSPDEATAWSAEIYAAFSAEAAANPAAWNPVQRSAEDIATVTPGNRMISEPYPLSMNANPQVDQGAAVIMTSLAAAREHGVAEDKLVYVWGGAGADQAEEHLRRDGFTDSPAMAAAFERTLSQAGVHADDLDIVDIYSCFPVVPKLASIALDLPRDASLSVTGGHSAFGGPMNTYTLFAAVSITQRLRTEPGLALLHGNGGFVTYQHAVLLSDAPHAQGYVGNPEPVRIESANAPAIIAPVSGTVTVETATVEHGRDGKPATGFLVARTADGARFAAQTAPGDTASAEALSMGEPGERREVVGRTVTVEVDGAHVRISS